MLENTGVGSSPGCTSSDEKSIVRPSMRGGVPVLSRPTRSDSSRRRAARRFDGRITGAPALVLLETDVDATRQKRADRQHDRAAR